MSLKTALYNAKAEGAHLMAVPNPECYDIHEDPWDVPKTESVDEILKWFGQSDDFQIIFWNKHDVQMGHWIIYQGEGGVDWLQDCDTGAWTTLVTSGHEVDE